MLYSLLFSFSAFAAKNTCCICETGLYPEAQTQFFKVGCSAWLAGNGCDLYSKQSPIIRRYSKSRDLTQSQLSLGELCQDIDKSADSPKMGDKFFQIPKKCEKLKVGYVGHWDSSREQINYMKNTLELFIKHTDIPVEIDNTACLGMDDPEAMHTYVRSLKLSEDQYVTVKANQTISVGMWAPFIPGNQNLSAVADSRKSTVTLPKCKKYRKDECISFAQKGEAGKCIGDDGAANSIACCKSKMYKWGRGHNGKGRRRKTVTKSVWLEGKSGGECNYDKVIDLR